MIGTQIGRYRIDDELGRGGMGVVYRGTQVTLDRTVAIKMLPAHLADAENQERFRREALTLARLAHPNIVHIYDVEEADGHSFIMMEHVGGGSLGDRMRSASPFSATRAVEVMAPVLSALHAAHLAGVVHRDIKPDNILFTESGRPKLTDFGIAHMRDSGSRTRTGVMLGTPYYMSPEQAQGRPVTAAADLYAVGVVLYEMLGGQVPFTGEDPLSVALKHVQEAPRPLRELRPKLPIALCDLVHRALRKEPEARFSSAAAMQDALERTALDPAASGSAPAVAVATDGGSAMRSAESAVSAAEPAHPAVSAVSASGAAPNRSSGAAADAPRSGAWSGAAEALSTSTGRGVAAAAGAGRGALVWLSTPAWRGYPRAFWAGAAALVVAVGWLGAETLGSAGADADPAGPPPGIARVTDDDIDASEPAGTPISAGAGRAARGNASLGGDDTRPPLSEEDRAALRDLVRGTPSQEADDAQVDPDPVDADPLDRIEAERTGPLTLDDLRTPEPEESAETPPTDREMVRAIVDRQFRAVQQADRALFLGDFHPEARAEAAAEFDAAAAGATNIRSSLSNLSIEFPEPNHAFVTFDVAISFTVRADGRTVRQSYEEMWDLRREGDRWWIIAWN
ncbi:protein kinase [Gaopeijia maritima]|uniref:serine/threonine-protein kinase n=1 Tax=Gaopeijia maritima TaxID=3119007 RepID=UPI003253CDF9